MYPFSQPANVPRALPAILIFVAMLLSVPATLAQGSSIFRIATASKAGTFYPIGGLIAQGVSAAPNCTAGHECGVPGVIALAQVSNGSVANVETIAAGGVESGLAQADVIYWAYTGTGRFSGKPRMSRLRAIANLYPGSLHVVARADSGITRIDDLRNRRVALDEPGSGTLATAELILASVDIDKNDLSPLYIKHNHAGPMLSSGQVDAFFFVAGYPTKSVVSVAKTTEIRLIPLSDATISRLIAERPYFTASAIPAKVYRGVEVAVPTVDIGTQLIVRDDLDEALVYAITAAIWSKRTRALLDQGHPKGVQVRLESALRGLAIPLHPGAARFYRERGLKVP
jgi:TRAP transporter TAXI family solute receptor